MLESESLWSYRIVFINWREPGSFVLKTYAGNLPEGDVEFFQTFHSSEISNHLDALVFLGRDLQPLSLEQNKRAS